MKPFFFLFCSVVFLPMQRSYSQTPITCASIGQRANSNGNANTCPNVNGTAFASNFAGTIYATVPASAKTGNVQLTYAGANASLLPFAITKVWLTTTGTTIQATSFGPASVPVVSGGNTQVNYCFYGSNLPTAGILSFQLTDPQTGTTWGVCSYDASCISNCTLLTNPVILPVKLEAFTAEAAPNGNVRLQWTTAEEQNNKGFAVERAEGDSIFTQLAFVPTANPAGTSSLQTSYLYIDAIVAGVSKAQYRLRQEDFDGVATYSQVVSVAVPAGGSSPRIYATGRRVVIEWPASNAFHPCDILVYDTQGRTLKSLHAGVAATRFIDGLPGHSIYYVALRNRDAQSSVMVAVYID